MSQTGGSAQKRPCGQSFPVMPGMDRGRIIPGMPNSELREVAKCRNSSKVNSSSNSSRAPVGKDIR